MELKVNYTLWDAERKKIHFFKTLNISEDEIIEMLHKKYEDNEFHVPIHLNKDELIVDFSISGGTF